MKLSKIMGISCLFPILGINQAYCTEEKEMIPDEDAMEFSVISRAKTEPVMQKLGDDTLAKIATSKSLPNLKTRTLSNYCYFQQKHSLWQEVLSELEEVDPSFFSGMASEDPIQKIVADCYMRIVFTKGYSHLFTERDIRGRLIIDHSLTLALNKKITQVREKKEG